MVPDGETFSTFVNPDICTPFFSADVLEKCALIALHFISEEGRDGEGYHVPVWGTIGKWVAQRVQCGRVETKLGRKTKVCPPAALVKAMCATMRCTSSCCMGVVTRSPFSSRIGSCEGGVGLVATWPWKCMRPGSSAAAAKRPFVTERKASLSSWTGCDNIGDVVRENEGRRNANDELFSVELACRVLSNLLQFATVSEHNETIRQKDDESISPFTDGTAKLLRRDHDFREPTPRREPTAGSEDFSRELRGEPGESQPTESTEDAEAGADFLVDPR